MAKFCGICGSPLDDNGVCTKCGTNNTQENVTQPTPEQNTVATTSTTSQDNVSAIVSSKRNLTKAQKAKIKLKVKISKKLARNKVKRVTKWKKMSKSQKTINVSIRIVALLLVLALLASVVCGVLVYYKKADIPFISSIYEKLGISKTSDSTEVNDKKTEQKSVESNDVIRNNGLAYYVTGNLLLPITDDESLSPVVTTDNDLVKVDNDRYAFDGKYIYTCSANKDLVKYEFVDKTTVKETVIAQSDILSNLGVNYPDISYMRSWELHGGYIYFNYVPTLELIETEKEYFYRLGRISIDGSHVEFIDDVRAHDFTIDHGFIYYQDNGFIGENSPLESDSQQLGIYKMNCKGGESELIYNDFELNITSVLDNSICSDMQIYDNHLYFIDNSIKGDKKLARIKLDGSDFEYLTQNPCHTYVVDSKNNAFYYIQSSAKDALLNNITFCKVDMKSKEETAIYECNVEYEKLFICNENVYFSDYSFNYGTEQLPELSGIRYNVTDGKVYSLYGYQSIVTNYDDTNNTPITEFTYTFNWIES